MILSRSVHQITYGDVIKTFCKKTSLQRTPPSNGHYCSSQRCPLFGGFTVAVNNHKNILTKKTSGVGEGGGGGGGGGQGGSCPLSSLQRTPSE